MSDTNLSSLLRNLQRSIIQQNNDIKNDEVKNEAATNQNESLFDDLQLGKREADANDFYNNMVSFNNNNDGTESLTYYNTNTQVSKNANNLVYGEDGKLLTGTKDGLFYSKGRLYTGYMDGVYYRNGQKYTGEIYGLNYKEGKIVIPQDSSDGAGGAEGAGTNQGNEGANVAYGTHENQGGEVINNGETPANNETTTNSGPHTDSGTQTVEEQQTPSVNNEQTPPIDNEETQQVEDTETPTVNDSTTADGETHADGGTPVNEETTTDGESHADGETPVNEDGSDGIHGNQGGEVIDNGGTPAIEGGFEETHGNQDSEGTDRVDGVHENQISESAENAYETHSDQDNNDSEIIDNSETSAIEEIHTDSESHVDAGTPAIDGGSDGTHGNQGNEGVDGPDGIHGPNKLEGIGNLSAAQRTNVQRVSLSFGQLTSAQFNIDYKGTDCAFSDMMRPKDEFDEKVSRILENAFNTGNVNFAENNNDFTITSGGITLNIFGFNYENGVSKFEKIELIENDIKNTVEFNYTDNKLQSAVYKLQNEEIINEEKRFYQEKITLNINSDDQSKVNDTNIIRRRIPYIEGREYIENLTVDSDLNITALSGKYAGYTFVLDAQTGIYTELTDATYQDPDHYEVAKDCVFIKSLLNRSALLLKNPNLLIIAESEDSLIENIITCYYTNMSLGYDMVYPLNSESSYSYNSEFFEGAVPSELKDKIHVLQWSYDDETGEYRQKLMHDHEIYNEFYPYTITDPFNQDVIDKINSGNYFNELHAEVDFSKVDFGEEVFADFEIPEGFEITDNNQVIDGDDYEQTSTIEDGNVDNSETQTVEDEQQTQTVEEVVETSQVDNGETSSIDEGDEIQEQKDEISEEENEIKNNVLTFPNGTTLELKDGETAVTNDDGTVTVTSADGKTITNYLNTGVIKSENTTVISNDGLKTQTNTEYNKNGVISKKTETVSKEDKNVRRTEFGYNPDGKLSREVIWTDFIVNNIYQHHVDIKYDEETGEIAWIVEADGQATSATTVSNKDGSNMSIFYHIGGDNNATLTPQKGQHIVLYGYRYDGSVKNGWDVFKYGAYHSTTKLEKHLYTFENDKKLYVAEYETLKTNDDGTVEVKDKSNIVTKYDKEGNIISVKNADFVETQQTEEIPDDTKPVDETPADIETTPVDETDKPNGTQAEDEQPRIPDNIPVINEEESEEEQIEYEDLNSIYNKNEIARIQDLINSESWGDLNLILESNIAEEYRTSTYNNLSDAQKAALKNEIDALVEQGKWSGQLPLWYTNKPAAVTIPAHANANGQTIPAQRLTIELDSSNCICFTVATQNSDGSSTENSVHYNNNGGVDNVETYARAQNGDLINSEIKRYNSDGNWHYSEVTKYKADGSMVKIETLKNDSWVTTTTTNYSKPVVDKYKVLNGYDAGTVKVRYTGSRDDKKPKMVRRPVDSVTVTEYTEDCGFNYLDGLASYWGDTFFSVKVKTETTRKKYTNSDGTMYCSSSETEYRNFEDKVIKTTSEKYELKEEVFENEDKFYVDDYGVKHVYKEIYQTEVQTAGEETTNRYACLITQDGEVSSDHGIKSEVVYEFDEDGHKTAHTETVSTLDGSESLGKTRYSQNEDGEQIIEILDKSDCDGKIGTYYVVDDSMVLLDNNTISAVLSAAKTMSDMGYDLVKEGIITWTADGDAIVRLHDLKAGSSWDGLTIPSDSFTEIKVEAKELLQNVRYAVGDRTSVALAMAVSKFITQSENNSTANSISWATSVSDAFAVLTGNLQLQGKYDVRESITSHTKWDDIKFLTLSQDVFTIDSFKWDISSPAIDMDSNPVDFGITESFLHRGHNGYATTIKDIYGREIYINSSCTQTFEVQSYNKDKNTVTIVDPHNQIPFEIDAEVADKFFIATVIKEPSESYVPEDISMLGENIENIDNNEIYAGTKYVSNEASMQRVYNQILNENWDNFEIVNLETDIDYKYSTLNYYNLSYDDNNVIRAEIDEKVKNGTWVGTLPSWYTGGKIEKIIDENTKMVQYIDKNDYLNQILMTKNSDGTWTGKIKALIPGANTHSEGICQYNANGTLLYMDYNSNRYGKISHGRKEYYSDGTLKAHNYYEHEETNDINKIFYPNYLDVHRFEEFNKEGKVVKDFEEILVTVFDKTIGLDPTLRIFNSNGDILQSLTKKYEYLETLDGRIPFTDKGIITKMEYKFDNEGECTGYIETLTYMNGEPISTIEFDKSGNFVKNINIDDCDGEFGYCTQGRLGTCHLLATLKTLCDNGLDLEESDIIFWDKTDGSAKVRLFDFDEEGNEIPKVYTITAKELAEKRFEYNGKKYSGSSGDRTGIAIEFAYAKFVLDKNNGNGDVSDSSITGNENSIMGNDTYSDLKMLFGNDARNFNYSCETHLWEFGQFNRLKTICFPFKDRWHDEFIGWDYAKYEEGKYYIQDKNTGLWVRLFAPHLYYAKYNEKTDTVTITNPHNLISFEVDAIAVNYIFPQDVYDIPEEWMAS